MLPFLVLNAYLGSKNAFLAFKTLAFSVMKLTSGFKRLAITTFMVLIA